MLIKKANIMDKYDLIYRYNKLISFRTEMTCQKLVHHETGGIKSAMYINAHGVKAIRQEDCKYVHDEVLHIYGGTQGTSN